RPVAMGRVDRGEKDLRGQVGGPLTVPDPAGDEPLHLLDVLAVEHLEQLWIDADRAQLLSADAALAGTGHAQVAAERARRRDQGFLCLHVPYWSRGRKVLPAGGRS